MVQNFKNFLVFTPRNDEALHRSGLVLMHDAAGGRFRGHSCKNWKPRSKPWILVANQLSEDRVPSERVGVLQFCRGNLVISMETTRFPIKIVHGMEMESWKLTVEKIIEQYLVPVIL